MITIVQGCYFTYAGISSQDWDLILAGIEESGLTTDSGSKYELITGRINGSDEELFYGIKVSESLSPSLEIVTSQGIDIPYEQYLDIKDWLFGQTEPQPLIIEHPDLCDYYFPCLFQAKEDLCYTGAANGLSITLRIMTPYAYKVENAIFSNTFSPPPTDSPFIKTYQVQTAEIKGCKPVVKIEMNGAGNASVVNLKNGSSICLKNAPAGTVTADCQTQIITPLSYIDYISFQDNINSSFLTLENGENDLQISGNIRSITIIYKPSRRLGCG